MNVACTTDICPVLLNSKCVFYESSALPDSGINTNDSIQVVVQKLDAAIASSGGGGVWGAITGSIADQTDLITYLGDNYAAIGADISIFNNDAGYITGATADGDYWRVNGTTTLSSTVPSIILPFNQASALDFKWVDTSNSTDYFVRFDTTEPDFISIFGPTLTFGKESGIGNPGDVLLLKMTHQPTTAGGFDDLTLITKKYVDDASVTAGSGTTKVGTTLNWGGTTTGDVTLQPTTLNTQNIQIGTFNSKAYLNVFTASERVHFYINPHGTSVSSNDHFVVYTGTAFAPMLAIDKASSMRIRATATDFFIDDSSGVTDNYLVINPISHTFSTLMSDGTVPNSTEFTQNSISYDFKIAGSSIFNIIANTITATSAIKFRAGSIAVGAAPAYFQSGTALTTPADGALEYHTSHLYFTIGSTRYQLDQQGGGGITNTAAANEMMKSDGTNAVPSGIFSSSIGLLEIRNGAKMALQVGADNGATTLTNAVVKWGGFSVPHYTLAEEPFQVIWGDANVSANTVFIGGNNALANSATNIQFWLGATSTTVTGNSEAVLNSAGFHIGRDITTGRKLTVVEETATTNAVTQLARFSSRSTGTPAIGIGVGIEFEVETASLNYEIAGNIEAVMTSVTSTVEYSDLVFKAMGAGTLAETLRMSQLAGPTTRLTVQGTSVDIAGTGWTFNNPVFVNNNMKVGTIGDAVIDRRLHVEENSSGTNTVLYAIRMTRVVNSGNGAAGIGVGMEFEAENGSGTNIVGATVEMVSTDVTAGSEDFDLVFKGMAAGAAAIERLRIVGDGYLRLPNATTAPAAGEVDACRIYCKDVTASSELFVRDEAGVETQLS